MASFTRLLGDVHGKVRRYKDLIHDAPYSIQLGDFGFAREYAKIADVDPERHKILLGNHDDYDHIPPHALGDFGLHEIEGFPPMFYMRGAYSVDHKRRTLGVDLWTQEQLTWQECERAIAAYCQAKPLVMLSHDCPFTIGDAHVMGRDWAHSQTYTNMALEEMWKEHKPRLWVFAHYHMDWRRTIEGCELICLDELSHFDLHPEAIQ